MRVCTPGDTGQLWATKVQYMNDSTEFRLAVELAKEVLAQRHSTADAKGQRLLHGIIERIGAIVNVNICSVSFCADPDLLSQWRGYSGDDGGFSIGFRSKPLLEIAHRDGGRLGYCIYNEEEQAYVINGMIDDALQTVAKLDNPLPIDFLRFAADFDRVLMKYGVFFKHHSFHEEQEWRLVTYITAYLNKKFCFRPGKSILLPYYRIPLRLDAWKDEIAAVTVGPCPHPDLAKMAVEGLLMKHCIMEGENSIVTPSIIPYRNW